MTALLLHILAVIVYTTAGGALFFIMYNRRLLPMKDRLVKRVAVPAAFTALTTSSFIAGLVQGCSSWLIAPAGFLVVVAVGETHRLLLRRGYRASPPVSETGKPHSVWRPLTTTQLAIRRYELPLRRWKGDRTRIVHLSDFHANSKIPFSYYERVMSEAVKAKPDLVFMTGDFVSHAKYVPLLAELLPLLSARYGVYAVLGNHDHWTALEEAPQALIEGGVTLLGNKHLSLRPGGAELIVSGCEIPWCDDEWQPAPRESDAPLLVLTHTADNIYDLAAANADVVFAGHYHGGQVNLPVIGSLACPSRFGRRFDQGHFLIKGTHLFVTAGIGCHFPPLRLYCPPEILIVDLLPES